MEKETHCCQCCNDYKEEGSLYCESCQEHWFDRDGKIVCRVHHIEERRDFLDTVYLRDRWGRFWNATHLGKKGGGVVEETPPRCECCGAWAWTRDAKGHPVCRDCENRSVRMDGQIVCPAHAFTTYVLSDGSFFIVDGRGRKLKLTSKGKVTIVG